MTLPRPLIAATLAVFALTVGVPAEAKSKNCPPGLAKKEVPCVPPGQAKKGYDEDDHRDWRRGDRIYGDYVLIPRAEWERLRLRDYRDQSTYLRVDNQILRVVRDTMTVIEAVRIIDRVLD